MIFKEIYDSNKDRVKVSFEVFPPICAEKSLELCSELNILKQFEPAFVSLTWGAGGNNNTSLEIIKKIQEIGLDVTPHFTCVCSTKQFVDSHIRLLKTMDIDKIIALRGDIPEDKSLCCNDFRYANELVGYLKRNSTLSIGVAGYPEGHIEAQSLAIDIKNLKKKIDSGATAIYTQMFFDIDKFCKYRELVNNAGITVPIIPGIMPILSRKQIDKMTHLAKITIPKKLQNKIEKYQNSNADMQKLGVEFGTELCEKLLCNNVFGLHFFTLNKSKSTKEILDNIL